jgi:hypothetical protein
MNAALLCPGPSLARTFDDAFAGLRVGVNRAATAYRCDWFAALDYPTIRDYHAQVLGEPKLLTRSQTWVDVHRQCRFDSATIAEDLVSPVPSRELLTATAALVLLGSLGVQAVNVYGADWTPDAPDFDGKATGENRSAERFVREAVQWGQIVEWMNGRGISVKRITEATPRSSRESG